MSRHEQMIRAHFEAWNARDRDGMVRDLTEDIVIEEDGEQVFRCQVFGSHEAARAAVVCFP